MLQDLSSIIEQCKNEIAGLDETRPFEVSQGAWESIRNYFESNYTPGNVAIVGDTIVTDNKGLKTYINAQEFPRAKAVVPYNNALNAYGDIANQISTSMGLGNRVSTKENAFFRAVPNENWKSTKTYVELETFETALNSVLPDQTEKALFEKFLNDPSWAGLTGENGKTKKLNRNDWKESGLLKVGGWVAAGASGRWRLIDALSSLPNLETEIQTQSRSIPQVISTGLDSTRLKGGVNRIFYGAPGTGKSHKVDNLTINSGHKIFRTVFHPDVQNSDFVGSLKPVMDNGAITYKFSPGQFANALVAAIINPTLHVSLIIEELNRAPAAAVFGELFLLLDRNTDGGGEYDTNFPNEEFMTWYQSETQTTDKKMRLPSNLSIYATMNSADQGVYPLDTAFRRRWQQSYVEIDYDNAPSGNISIAKSTSGTISIEWATFIRILNKHLAELSHIEEDRLIGPWFVKPYEIATGSTIPEKLLIYLWDDLLRHEGRDTVFSTERFSTYGSLSSALVANTPILSQELLSEYEALVPAENANT